MMVRRFKSKWECEPIYIAYIVLFLIILHGILDEYIFGCNYSMSQHYPNIENPISQDHQQQNTGEVALENSQSDQSSALQSASAPQPVPVYDQSQEIQPQKQEQVAQQNVTQQPFQLVQMTQQEILKQIADGNQNQYYVLKQVAPQNNPQAQQQVVKQTIAPQQQPLKAPAPTSFRDTVTKPKSRVFKTPEDELKYWESKRDQIIN